MSFHSLEYAVLLLTALTGFWLLASHRHARVALLLGLSYVFYGAWNPKYLVLIAFTSTLDFTLCRLMAKTESRPVRRLLLVSSLVASLGILFFFKYFNFLGAEVAAALHAFGLQWALPRLEMVLPVGISFYTFQTVSYVVDVYRRELTPAKSYLDYLLFVSFFPHVVSGPIVRAGHMLPQYEQTPHVTAEQGSAAVGRIAIGLVKKAVIADYLGAHIVNPVFSNPEMYSSAETLVAAYAYTFQLYADFSAYSDIAIGSSSLLGFQLPENFRSPYKAASLKEFWQRWHISLSSWLRDYLYISLGGNRKGRFRTTVNLMLTMLIGGLWHGAAMTFIAWGAIHGGALVVSRLIEPLRLTAKLPPRLAKLLCVILTFHVVVVAWVFFRAPSFAVALQVFEALGSFTFGTSNLPAPVLVVLAVAALSHFLPDDLLNRLVRRSGTDSAPAVSTSLARDWVDDLLILFNRLPAPAQALVLIGAIATAHLAAQSAVSPFIYGQF